MIELMTEDQLKTRREQRDRCEEDPCGSFECEFCNQDEDRPRPVKYVPGDVRFVNVHMVHRCYGGPEEGGWWFDTGELVEVWAMPNEAAAKAKASALEMGEYSNDDRRPLHSVCSNGVYRVTVSDTPGQDWPERFPRYE